MWASHHCKQTAHMPTTWPRGHRITHRLDARRRDDAAGVETPKRLCTPCPDVSRRPPDGTLPGPLVLLALTLSFGTCRWRYRPGRWPRRGGGRQPGSSPERSGTDTIPTASSSSSRISAHPHLSTRAAASSQHTHWRAIGARRDTAEDKRTFAWLKLVRKG